MMLAVILTNTAIIIIDLCGFLLSLFFSMSVANDPAVAKFEAMHIAVRLYPRRLLKTKKDSIFII